MPGSAAVPLDSPELLISNFNQGLLAIIKQLWYTKDIMKEKLKPQNIIADLLEDIPRFRGPGYSPEEILRDIRAYEAVEEECLLEGWLMETDLLESTKITREMNDVELLAAIGMATKIEDQEERECHLIDPEESGVDDDYDFDYEELYGEDPLAGDVDEGFNYVSDPYARIVNPAHAHWVSRFLSKNQ